MKIIYKYNKMEGEKYKCGVLISNFPDAYTSGGNITKGLIIDIWDIIKRRLYKKKINIEEIIINKENGEILDWEKYIKEIKNGKYDIVIAPFWIRLKRLEIVDFTFPLYYKKQVVVYSIPENPKIDYYKYLQNLIKIWILPFVIFVIISLIFGLILNYFNKNKIKKNIYYSVSGFFGQTSGLMFDNGINKHFSVERLIILFVILLFNLYISTTTVSESVLYLKRSNKLENSIKGEKIAVSGPEEEMIIKEKGGIPIMVKGDKYSYYIKNRFNGISGFMSGSLTIGRLISDHKNLRVSKLNFGNELVAFPINKKKKKLREAIDDILIQIKSDDTVISICNEYTIKNGITQC